MHVGAVSPYRALTPLDEAERRRHKRRNLLHSVLLLGGMVLIAGVSGWVLFGPDGMLGLALGMGLVLAFGQRVSPRMVLGLYSARPLQPEQAPDLYRLLQELCRRAGLERCPNLWYVRTTMLNAFAVGSRDDPAIAVTDGLLRRLSARELAGVLAHEVSHIRNNDLWLMNLADLVGRMTRAMTFMGLILLFLGLPMWLAGGGGPPLLLILLLVLAPQLTLLLQLALSRAREFDADLDAAGITRDADGLSSALLKLEHYQRGFFERLLLPGQRAPEPSILRTHPPTAERVARLRSLRGRQEPDPPVRWPELAGVGWPEASHPPRGRMFGFWY